VTGWQMRRAAELYAGAAKTGPRATGVLADCLLWNVFWGRNLRSVACAICSLHAQPVRSGPVGR
jgi:hypothetical protein